VITTLTGENSFKLTQELRSLRAAFLAEHDELGLERIDAEEADYNKIQEAVTSLPFLASKKLVLLKSPSKNKQFVENHEQLLAELPETTDLVIIEPKLDKRITYYKYLKKSTEFKEFNELDINGLASWIVAEAKEKGGSISSSDARYLVERVGAKQQLLSNELEKLFLYAPSITRANIDLLTDPTPQSTIFELLEVAFHGEHKRAMKIYAEQRALKVEPQQIIAMLTWQLHVLAIIKTAGERSANEIASEAKISPYVVSKSQNIARGLTLTQLRTLISDLLKIDTRSKRSSLDLDEALQHYLLTLA
jgi:DNA polymerase III delta subunit